MTEEEFVLDDDLVEIVLAEAQENLENAIVLLSSKEREPEMVDALFRCFHSIKGNCAMAHRTDLSNTAHQMETELDRVRTAGRPLTTDETGLFLELSDLLVLLLTEADQTVLAPIDRCLRALNEKIGGISRESSKDDGEGVPSDDLIANDEVRARGDGEKQNARLKVDVGMLLSTMKVAGELFQLDERLKHFSTKSASESNSEGDSEGDSELRDGLHQISREFDGAIERLYELLLDIQRLPVAQIASPLERAVRDIKRKTGKEINFTVLGRDLRVDKQVLQVLSDPLMHMVRNSADHGIEIPEVRSRSGKGVEGSITLQVEDLDDIVAVTIQDDGAGIDVERVKAKAIERGIVSALEAEKLSQDEIVEFIFHAGFSTADAVSELSGRGVGMDVVMQQIRASGGAVITTTVLGEGTTFRLEVPKAGSPVTDGLAVRTGETIHLIPMKNVVTFVGRKEMCVWRQPDNQVLSRVGEDVYPVLRVPGEPDALCLNSSRTIGVLLEDRRGERVLVPVDDVLGRRKALVQRVDKKAGEEFARSEVCILGDGTMAFSLHIDSLMEDRKLIWRTPADDTLGHHIETEVRDAHKLSEAV